MGRLSFKSKFKTFAYLWERVGKVIRDRELDANADSLKKSLEGPKKSTKPAAAGPKAAAESAAGKGKRNRGKKPGKKRKNKKPDTEQEEQPGMPGSKGKGKGKGKGKKDGKKGKAKNKAKREPLTAKWSVEKKASTACMFEMKGAGNCHKENCSFSHDAQVLETERVRRSKAAPGGPPRREQDWSALL